MTSSSMPFQIIVIAAVFVAMMLFIMVVAQTMATMTITVANQPNWCEDEGQFHAFVYDADGHGEFRGNWSVVKNFLIYQNTHYQRVYVRDTPAFGEAHREDIYYTVDDYLRKKDAQCGPGVPLELPIEILDPASVKPVTPAPTPIPTPTPRYDYDGFGRVAV